FSDDRAFSGTQSAQININQGTTAFGYWGGIKSFPEELGEGDEIWVRLRTFFPSGFDFNTNISVLKFLRFRVKEDDGTHLGYHDLMIWNDGSYYKASELRAVLRVAVFPTGNEYEYAQNYIIGETVVGETSGAIATVTAPHPRGFHFEYNAGSPLFVQFETITGQTSGENRTRVRYIRTSNNTRFGSDYPIKTNVWETIVVRYRFSTTNPLLQFYKNVGETGFDSDGKPIGGSIQLIYEDSIDKTLKSPTDKVGAFFMFTYWNGGAPQTQNMYIDDLWISTSPPPELPLDLVFSDGFDL
ncbi:hypothetical protein MNBD_GAMMA01-558, partial [hydrothermal vent metagenome]